MGQLTDKMHQYNTLRKEVVQEKREKVLEHALELFLEKGIDNISMNDIGKTSQVSRATLYRYFENKETIITVLASRMMGIIYDVAFRDLTFDSMESLAQGYKQMVFKFHELSFAYKYMSMFSIYYANSELSPELQEIYLNKLNSLVLPHMDKLGEKAFNRNMMMLNLTMDFLEDIALHEKMIPITQGISIEVLLEEYSQVIDAIVKA